MVATIDMAGGTLSPYWGPPLPNNSPLVQQVMRAATIAPFDTYPALGNFEWQHNSPQGDIFHLTSGPSQGSAASMIGLGVDYGGRGLYVHNHGDHGGGLGIVITQDPLVTVGHYGLLINAGAGAAPAVWLQQAYDAVNNTYSTGAVFFAYSALDASQKLLEFRYPGTGISGSPNDGSLGGYVRAQDGALIWQAPVTVSGASITVQSSAGVGGTMLAEAAQVAGASASIELYNSSQTANKRRFKWSVSGNILVLAGRNDADSAGTGDLLYCVNSDQNIGIAGQNSFGGGTKVLAMPNAGTIPSSNPTAGGVLYVTAGALTYRGSSGTVTTLGPA